MYRFKSLDNEWEYVGEMPEPRHHHSTVYLGGRVYLVGKLLEINDINWRFVVDFGKKLNDLLIRIYGQVALIRGTKTSNERKLRSVASGVSIL